MAKRPAKKKGSGSQLEADFEALWKFYKGPELVREHVFYPGRKWRSDFAHVASKVLVEIEGGIWNQGRHTRGKGYQDDCEKYNSAALAGWTVVRLAGKEMISRDWVERIKGAIEGRIPSADSECSAQTDLDHRRSAREALKAPDQ